MTMMFMLDNTMSRAVEALAPHKNMVDPNKPRTLTGVASMPKPVASSIIHWLGGEDRENGRTVQQESYRQELLRRAVHRQVQLVA